MKNTVRQIPLFSPRSARILQSMLLQDAWLLEPQYALGKFAAYLAQSKKNTAAAIDPRRPTVQGTDGFAVEIAPGSTDSLTAVAIHRYDGVLRQDETLCGSGVSGLVDQMRAADKADEITAHVLELNTGGGTVTAASELRNGIRELTKPIVVYTTYLASGGVLATLDAAEIVIADENTEVGSIGVMLSIDKQAAQWWAENIADLYAETSPNKRYEWREFLKGNPQPIISRLNRFDSNFMAAVKAARPLQGSPEKINETLSGGIFQGADAVARGLADSIGTRAFAIQRAGKYGASHQKNLSNMNFNTNFGNLIARLTGKPVESETEAIAALETAAPAADWSAKLDAANAQIEALESQIQIVITQAETLKADIEAAQHRLANLTAENVRQGETIAALKTRLGQAGGDKNNIDTSIETQSAFNTTSADGFELPYRGN